MARAGKPRFAVATIDESLEFHLFPDLNLQRADDLGDAGKARSLIGPHESVARSAQNNEPISTVRGSRCLLASNYSCGRTDSVRTDDEG